MAEGNILPSPVRGHAVSFLCYGGYCMTRNAGYYKTKKGREDLTKYKVRAVFFHHGITWDPHCALPKAYAELRISPHGNEVNNRRLRVNKSQGTFRRSFVGFFCRINFRAFENGLLFSSAPKGEIELEPD